MPRRSLRIPAMLALVLAGAAAASVLAACGASPGTEGEPGTPTVSGTPVTEPTIGLPPPAAATPGHPTRSLPTEQSIADPLAGLHFVAPPEAAPVDTPGLLDIEVDRYDYAHIAPNPWSGAVVFAANGDIWSLDARGEATNLTRTDDRAEGFPRWSPDGSTIAFASRSLETGTGTGAHQQVSQAARAGDAEAGAQAGAQGVEPGLEQGVLALMSADGSDYRVVGEHDLPWAPTWAHDGSALAYVADGRLWLYNLATDQLFEALAGPPGLTLTSVAWSPVDNRIAVAFAEGEDLVEGRDVVEHGYAEINIDTGAVRELLRFRAAFQPLPPAQWAPHGKQLLFALTPALAGPGPALPLGVWVVSEDGSVTHTGRVAHQALWSPDGSRIALIEHAERRIEILDSETLQILERPGPSSGVEAIAWLPLPK